MTRGTWKIFKRLSRSRRSLILSWSTRPPLTLVDRSASTGVKLSTPISPQIQFR